MGFLYFFFGQALAVLGWWLHWKTPDKPWMRYWNNGHLAQHGYDFIISIFILAGWKSGALAATLSYFGAEGWSSKLPEVPAGSLALFFLGGIFTIFVGMIKKWIDSKQPPATA